MNVYRSVVLGATIATTFYAPSAGAQQLPTPRDQLAQLVTDLQKNPSDDELREKITRLVHTLDPAPAIPSEAIEHEGAAEYIFKHATSLSDFSNAAAEYEQALLIAPWVAADYFNLGSCWGKAGDPARAVRAYQFYLLAAPNARDAGDVTKQIGALKYELAQKRRVELSGLAQRQADSLAALAGREADEQGRQLQERLERQRLANLDPIVAQLDGAVFANKIRMGTVPESYGTSTYTVRGGGIIFEFSWPPAKDDSRTYKITGRQFELGALDDARDRCDDGRIVTERRTVGTISTDAIAFTTYDADGRVCWQQMPISKAKRIK